jgi:CO/xanthine dehydrogenase FAD-binding subunit
VKPPLFDYVAPRAVDEAIAHLQADAGAMILAGGQSLIPAMNMRLASPSQLIDIQHIPELARINVANGRITVGAMARHRELELHAGATAANPVLRMALGHVAHIPIRNRGTVVGSLCHADAAAEMPMILVLTGGSVLAAGRAGRREIAAEDFFQFHMTTSRQPDELVVEAYFPSLSKGAGFAFEEFTRRHGDYAIAAVGCILSRNGKGAVETVALAACGVTSKPVRLKAAEDILTGSKLSEADIKAAGEAAQVVVTAPDDLHATAGYRKHLFAALIRRAVENAAARAQ